MKKVYQIKKNTHKHDKVLLNYDKIPFFLVYSK